MSWMHKRAESSRVEPCSNRTSENRSEKMNMNMKIEKMENGNDND